jgi:hypothetical protein
MVIGDLNEKRQVFAKDKGLSTRIRSSPVACAFSFSYSNDLFPALDANHPRKRIRQATDTRVLAAIQLADTPYLRALPDFANSLMGGDERFNARAVQHMFAHAWNIAHVKDAEIIRDKREMVSLSELFAIAKAARYRGYYSMESDSDVDPVVDTKHLIEQSLTLM